MFCVVNQAQSVLIEVPVRILPRNTSLWVVIRSVVVVTVVTGAVIIVTDMTIRNGRCGGETSPDFDRGQLYVMVLSWHSVWGLEIRV